MDSYLREQFESSLWVLSDMEATFEQWYPEHFDFLPEEEQEHLTQAEMKEAKKQFSRTKLNLELGEYTSADYDYLKWIEEDEAARARATALSTARRKKRAA